MNKPVCDFCEAPMERNYNLDNVKYDITVQKSDKSGNHVIDVCIGCLALLVCELLSVSPVIKKLKDDLSIGENHEKKFKL